MFRLVRVLGALLSVFGASVAKGAAQISTALPQGRVEDGGFDGRLRVLQGVLLPDVASDGLDPLTLAVRRTAEHRGLPSKRDARTAFRAAELRR